MKEPRCIAQLLRNQQSLTPINFTITHGRGRKGIIIRTRKPSVISTAIVLMKTRRFWKWL
ncbi:hypothetical protein MUU46_01855 [Scandinavium sp. TWS1a]|uniref:hypothetical protein n=1 Tax=Scandinavium tedordense TaxID=2926521 RepID=UPI002165169E|nr:hypothetical protein [Scandinavium tedordense]MCS2169073.1 hypothetical protein [Scandinavium tedordense]